MLYGQKIVVVMPAYNAARKWLQRTYEEVMAQGIVDLAIVVDDASHDETRRYRADVGERAGGSASENRGYGGTKKLVIASRWRRVPALW